MPVSKYYKPVGNVQVPDPNDPVDMSVSPGMTSYQFGAPDVYAAQRGGMRPVTQREIGADALQRAIMGIADMPSDLSTGSLQMMRQSIPAMPETLKAKPQETYGSNRGGNGMAGRGSKTPQFGSSTFDTGAGYEPLEMPYPFDDKPWELDDNTKADVAPGTSFEPQKDNITDRQPDLNSPAGMYEALSKKYPDLLTKNLDQLEQSRVSMEDVDALRDRAGLGSLFIAASKAASGAGSVGGKQPESIAEKIVSREDTLARQQLKDRMDVASENMAMTGKAIDLAIKQINFADEREQYDPNSEVSRFARDFMRSEFELNIPDNVPAYQLKQFLPAMMQKYQTKERIAYQNALLGQKSTDIGARLQSEKDIANIRAQSAKDVANIAAQARKDVQAMKPAPGTKPGKMLGSVPADVAKVEMDLAGKFRTDKTVQAHELMKNELAQLRTLASEGTPQSDQALITKFAKILDPGSVVRETEFAITERGGGLIDSMRNTISKAAGTGRLQPGQRQNLIQTAEALFRGIEETYQAKRKQFMQQGELYGARPEAIVGVESAPAAPTGGMSLEKKKRLEELRRKKGLK